MQAILSLCQTVGCHIPDCQHIKLHFVCQQKSLEIAYCIMPAVLLFVVAIYATVKMDILIAEHENFTICISGIQENKWLNWV